MPSTSTCTWLGLAPRIEIEVDLPKLPERRMSTPGTPRSASSTVGYRRVSISSPVITVTEAPSCSAGVSVRVAVTTTGSACLTSCACAVLTMTASITTAIHDVRGMPDSFFRERVERLAPGRFPDSWIDAAVHAFPSFGERQWLPLSRVADGAPHSQWRDRAGLSPASLAPGARCTRSAAAHPLSYARWTTGRPLALLSTVTRQPKTRSSRLCSSTSPGAPIRAISPP